MTKKFTAVIVLTCMLFTLFTPCAFAIDSPFYKLIAEEPFSEKQIYSAQAWGGQINNAYYNGMIIGTGWTSNFLVKEADGSYAKPTDKNIQLYYFEGSSNPSIRLNNTKAILYRTLKNSVDFNGASGEYTFSFTAKGIVAASVKKASEVSIGESVAFGFTGEDGGPKVIPYIKVNGETVYSNASVTMSGTNSKVDRTVITLKVILNRAGEDIITVSATYPNETTATATTTAEVSGIADYIRFDLDTGYFDDFKFEYDNPAAYDRITNIIQNGATDAEELKAAFADMIYYNGADKADVIADLKEYATGEFEGADIIELEEISEDVNKLLIAKELNSFDLKYNFKLNDDVVFGIYNKATGVAATGVTSEVNGTEAKITLSQNLENGVVYEIRATGTDFKGDIIPPIEFTTSPIPEINLSDGGHYSQGTPVTWTDDGNTTFTVTLKNASGDVIPVSYGDTLDDIGPLEFTVTATKNDITDTVVMNITVEEDFPPVASKVKFISGEAETDSVLEVDFDFYDENNDSEGEHIIIWYKNTAEGKTEIGRGRTYQLQESDENSDIVVSVTPVAASYHKPQGEEVLSEVFKGAYKPVATDAKISGEIEEDKELEVLYTFSDANGDDKGTPVVRWFVKGEDGDTEITDNISNGKLTITSQVFDKYVYATIIPVSAKKPYNGDMIATEAVLMPSTPVVSNVRIEGIASVGNVLIAYYSFEDPNLDEQGKFKYEWKDSAGNVIGRERNLTITDTMAGKTITVTVIGVSIKSPTDSAPVTSAAVTISGGASSVGGGSTGGVVSGGGGFGYSGGTSGSSSGGSSSGGSSSGGSSGTTTPVTPVTPDPPKTETVFGDVYGHWAQEYVTVLLEKGVVSKDENFRPDDSISRAEVLAMLFRSAGIDLSEYNGAYGDVKAGDWFADYIQTALDAGIISADDNFRPNDGITREEAAKIIAIMLKLKSENAAEFADNAAISDWAAEYVNAVYEAGIFKGDEEGNFSPKGALTRAETATVIYRLLNDNAFDVEVPDNEK